MDQNAGVLVAPGEPAPVTAVSIVADIARRVNFASAQNDVAIIRSLEIVNGSDAPVENLTVALTATPPVIRPRLWTLDRLAPGSRTRLADLQAEIDLAFLAGLNEAEVGELRLAVEGPDGPLAEARFRLDLLARDEWGGVGEMAQILAAFVAPNDPVVATICKEASLLLERAGHSGALDGYQSKDPQRCWLVAGAIWAAATALGLSYANPPASFEAAGQKVRGPARIRAEGLATCLDSTLLLAAAFETAGLNPVVLFARGHAWVGVWLVERDFGHVTEPDVVAVRKAAQSLELVPIETTLLTRRPAMGFAHAVDEGRRRLDEEREDEFVMAVDIARARAARIRPLASHLAPGNAEAPHVDTAPAALPPPLDLGRLPGELAEAVPDTPLGRIERWQRKLLDLSLRNRLLNFGQTGQTLPFLCPDVPELEDALADGHRFRPLALKDEDPVGDRQLTPEDRKRVEEAAAADAFARGQLAVPLTGREMESRLLTLHRKAKGDLQEGGTNTLFLAAGFLRWKKTATDPRSYRAPLLLIPVRLERRSAQSEFTLQHHEDEVSFNATLLEFLKRDFDLRIPELEGELPRDDSGIDVPQILKILRGKVRDIAGFEVVEDLALSTFSFSKYLMWKDLVDRTDDLRRNALVRHLVDTPSAAFPVTGGEPVRPEDLDARIDPREVVTLLPADSSQLAAVIAAGNGQDFVLIGPPGTGKSQTIANIVSHCLARGKTVLFVAEKAAALDVVYRRLSAKGLGAAVLELHSNKTDRKSVLAQLGRSWDRVAASSEGKWIEVTRDLRLTRDRLNAYAAALHAPAVQGFSIFHAIGWISAAPEGLKIAFAGKDAHDAESFARLERIARELGRTHAVVGDGAGMAMVAATDWSHAWEARFLDATRSLRGAAEALRRRGTELAEALGLAPDAKGTPGRRALLTGLAASAALPPRDLSAVPDLPPAGLRDLARAYGEDIAALDRARVAAAAGYGDRTIATIPLDALDAQWRQAATGFWPFSALARRKVRKLLQTYAETPGADPARDLPALAEMRARQQALAANPLDPIGGADRAAGLVADCVERAIALRQIAAEAGGELADPPRFGTALARLSGTGDGRLRDDLDRKSVV